MKESMYFVVSNSEGDTYISQKTKDELLEQLNLNEHGDIELKATDALESVLDLNTSYWNNRFLIIKGEIVTPKAVKIVTRFEI